MRLIGLLAALLAAQGYLCATPASVYAHRREALREKLKNGAIVLFGRGAHDAGELRSGFFQEPDFYYLTGWMEPGAILLLLPGEPREILFIPRRDPEEEIWTGRKFGPDDANLRAATGFEVVMPAETFESTFRKYVEAYPRLYGLAYRPDADKLKALAPLREVSDAAGEIAKLRMEKSPEELELMQHAVDVTIAAHRVAWKRAAPGLYEYQIAASMVAFYADQGCERSAYAPIVGSGPNSTVLHYARNSRRMDQGELLLMDVGAECAGYAADITRTIPVSGRFTPRQREIYDIVLAAQNATIAAVKPGMTIGKMTPNSLYQVAYDYINTHGKDRHGEPLGKYFTHGISHHIGLEVHDASDTSVALKEGMVISVEPGIYIPEENIGVRIEDDVVVTKDGCRVMSAALPRDAAEIEKAIGK
jgi:Xaa-Pro aminopeptidase